MLETSCQPSFASSENSDLGCQTYLPTWDSGTNSILEKLTHFVHIPIYFGLVHPFLFLIATILGFAQRHACFRDLLRATLIHSQARWKLVGLALKDCLSVTGQADPLKLPRELSVGL